MRPKLPPLTVAELEALVASVRGKLSEVEPMLARLAILATSEDHIRREALLEWLHAWREAGGTTASLVLTLEALLEQKEGTELADEGIELVWSGPDGGAGGRTRDQSVLIQQLVGKAQNRLLLCTYAIYQGPFIKALFEQIGERVAASPELEVRLICNIHRRQGDTSIPEALVRRFREAAWTKLWPHRLNRPSPQVFYDPRSVALDGHAVCHVKAVVADDDLLITSANLTDAAQLHNFELGVRLQNRHQADATWMHFEQLIQKGLLQSLFAEPASVDEDSFLRASP